MFKGIIYYAPLKCLLNVIVIDFLENSRSLTTKNTIKLI